MLCLVNFTKGADYTHPTQPYQTGSGHTKAAHTKAVNKNDNEYKDNEDLISQT